MDIWFLTASGIWIVTSLVRNVYEALKFKKPELRENKNIFRFLMFIMFFMWASWVFMSFSDPVKIGAATWLKYFGLATFVAGLLLFVLSEMTKGGVTEKGFLVTKGIYSKIRHPMYFGQMLMAIGIPLFGQGLVTLCLSIIWIAQLLFWKVLEEKELLAKYPEYEAYKKRTWF
jgi:protein-S-isoprenylcysteine O-methyltransferase Ste14